jgi:hypothetical protein
VVPALQMQQTKEQVEAVAAVLGFILQTEILEP